MNFLYISPEFPHNFKNFIIELNKLNVNVWAIGEAEFYYMPEDLRSVLRWYTATDINNYNEALRAIESMIKSNIALQIHRGFDYVESHNEHWLRLEAFINQKFNYDGVKLPEISRYKNKSVMKTFFSDNGFKVARGTLVGNLKDPISFAKEIGYPLILKPDEGVGANGIFRVDEECQLKAILNQIHCEYLMEEYINAKIVTYDGLTDKEGNVIFENMLFYGEGVLDNLMGRDTFFFVSKEILPKFSELGKKLVKIFGIKRKFFHFELFDTGNEYIPIEINARPPGGPIIDMMNYSVDDDLYRGYAEMIAKNRMQINQEKKYFVGYAGRKDKNYFFSHHEILDKYRDSIIEHGLNPELHWRGMGKYRYIFRDTKRENIYKIKEDILGTK